MTHFIDFFSDFLLSFPVISYVDRRQMGFLLEDSSGVIQWRYMLKSSRTSLVFGSGSSIELEREGTFE